MTTYYDPMTIDTHDNPRQIWMDEYARGKKRPVNHERHVMSKLDDYDKQLEFDDEVGIVDGI